MYVTRGLRESCDVDYGEPRRSLYSNHRDYCPSSRMGGDSELSFVFFVFLLSHRDTQYCSDISRGTDQTIYIDRSIFHELVLF